MAETVDVDLGAGSSEPQNQPQSDANSAVADWFAHVPKEYANEKLWEPIKTKPLPEVLKGYAEAQKLIGGSIRIPGDKATEEDWNKFYAKLGRPEKPEDYKIDSSAIPDEYRDESFEAGFRQAAHKLGLSAKQAEQLADWYNQTAIARVNEVRQAYREQLNGLLEEWGGAAKRNIAIAKRAVEHLGGEELRKFFNDSGLGDSPVLVKVFARVGQMLLEGGFIDEGQDVSSDEALKQAHAIIYDEKNPDHKAYVDSSDPRHREVVDRVGKLFEQHYNRPKV